MTGHLVARIMHDNDLADQLALHMSGTGRFGVYLLVQR